LPTLADASRARSVAMPMSPVGPVTATVSFSAFALALAFGLAFGFGFAFARD
jgi:hypothetical protein